VPQVAGNTDVQTSVIQFADGRLDRIGLIEPPKVYVRPAGEGDLTIKQARELAEPLLDGAKEVDASASSTVGRLTPEVPLSVDRD
jgi:hypothetical protein